MSETKEFNRWIVVIGTLMIMLCQGVVYLWSLFVPFMVDEFGWNLDAVAIVGNIMLAIGPMGAVVGGFMLPKLGSKKTLTIGGVLFVAGVFLTSVATSSTMALLTWGFLAAFGCGMIYVPALFTALSWFPDKPGLVVGLSLGTTGASTLLFMPLLNNLLPSYGVSMTFVFLGAIIAALIFPSALLMMRFAPQGWLPKGFKAAVNSAASAIAKKQYTIKEAIRTRPFITMFVSLFLASAGYVILVTIMVVYAMDYKGLSLELAVLGATLFGVASAAGSLVMSPLQDKLGSKRIMAICLAVMAVALVALIPAEGIFVIVLIPLVGFMYMGTSCVMPVMISKVFGVQFGGSIYSVMNLAFAAGNISLPILMTIIRDSTGGYDVPLILMAVFAIVSLVLFMTLKEKHIDDWKVTETVDTTVIGENKTNGGI